MMDSKKITVADEQLASRRKVAKMLISVVGAFAICYFPVHLLNILRYAGVHQSIGPNVWRAFNYIAHWLPYLNSSTNPIIYNFMSAKFRKEFVTACRCCRTDRVHKEMNTLSSTHYSSHYNTPYTHRHSTKTEQISLTAVR